RRRGVRRTGQEAGRNVPRELLEVREVRAGVGQGGGTTRVGAAGCSSTTATTTAERRFTQDFEKRLTRMGLGFYPPSRIRVIALRIREIDVPALLFGRPPFRREAQCGVIDCRTA